MRRLGILVLSLALVGCGGDADGDGSPRIASGNLRGKIAGQSWSLVTAQTDAFLSGVDAATINLWSEEVQSCSQVGTGDGVKLFVPFRLGEQPLNGEAAATFRVVSDQGVIEDVVPSKGLIRLDEASETVMRGGLAMTFDSGNSISGEFLARVCAD